VAFEKAKKYDQAIQFFEKYLERDTAARDAKEVKERIEGIKAIMATPISTSPDAPPKPVMVLPKIETKGLVIIDSKPAGALIYLDDKKNGVLARTPWQGSLPPRPVKLIVESKGFKPEERSISPRTDKVYEVYVALSEEHFLGWIEVASNVAGAEVFLDKKEIGAIGKTPYTGHLKPGKHTVWVEHVGYVSAQKEIEVQPGTATSHMIDLEKVANGWVSVAGKQSRGAKLKIDGKIACDTPCRSEVGPGKHKVIVEKEGFEDYRSLVDVTRSTETELQVTWSPKPPRTSAWTTSVMSALFLGGGITLAKMGKDLNKELKHDLLDASKSVNTADPRAQKGKYYYIGADILFGLSAVTALVATYNFLSSGPDSTAEVDSKTIGFAPFGDNHGAGLLARGRF
jgi:hypothetical protein